MMQRAPALLVVAAAGDVAACGFVARHASAGVALLVPRDLSRPGWHFRLGDPAATVMVTAGGPFRLADAGGVLMRLPAVTADDLPHIAAGDRIYVAAEITAFLLAVLTRDDLPVLNRPTPQCLCGPAWTDAKWRAAAATLGLPVKASEQRAVIDANPDKPEAAAATVSLAGETCIGAPNASLEATSRALGTFAGAEMLTVEFDGSAPSAAVLRAYPWVDPGNPRIEAALLRRFGVVPRRLPDSA
jgi:hypothetical protein